jgi:hypothetical protein
MLKDMSKPPRRTFRQWLRRRSMSAEVALLGVRRRLRRKSQLQRDWESGDPARVARVQEFGARIREELDSEEEGGTVTLNRGARIRWEAIEYGGFAGLVGPLETQLFQIWQPDDRCTEWQLTTAFIGAGGGPIQGPDPDVLKAEAESWLKQFVASLGAVFPEPAKAED